MWGISPGGFEQCLDLLHRIAANWPTPLIRSTENRWGLGEEHEQKKEAYAESEELEKVDELEDLEEATATDERGVVYPLHPFVETSAEQPFLGVCFAGRNDLGR